MKYWMLVSSADNFETSRRRGFDIAGMKSRHGRKAAEVETGDKVVFYLTGEMAFGATAEITGPPFFSEEPVWTSSRDGELYPHRFPIQIETAAAPGRYVPAAVLVPSLQHVTRWPPEHWRLAFQGNVHRLQQGDYCLIRGALQGRSGMQPDTK